jgi:D-hydroxyproline dehydrogenase subunit gamma
MKQQQLDINVDGRRLRVRADATLAAALAGAGVWRLRTSVGGEPRGPLCGMGSCFECRVTIDGSAHRRACLEPVVPGMDVRTA